VEVDGLRSNESVVVKVALQRVKTVEQDPVVSASLTLTCSSLTNRVEWDDIAHVRVAHHRLMVYFLA
jgi:hypothetical protein